MEKLGDVIERTDSRLLDSVLFVFGQLSPNDDIALSSFDVLINWNFRLTSRSTNRYGVCKPRQRLIEINSYLESFPTDFWQTLAHETAHAIEFILFADSNHGPRWRAIMERLGADPKRVGAATHAASEEMKAIKLERAREVWQCQKCGTLAPIQRRRKYPANKYTHRGCGGAFSVFETRK